MPRPAAPTPAASLGARLDRGAAGGGGERYRSCRSCSRRCNYCRMECPCGSSAARAGSTCRAAQQRWRGEHPGTASLSFRLGMGYDTGLAWRALLWKVPGRGSAPVAGVPRRLPAPWIAGTAILPDAIDRRCYGSRGSRTIAAIGPLSMRASIARRTAAGSTRPMEEGRPGTSAGSLPRRTAPARWSDRTRRSGSRR